MIVLGVAVELAQITGLGSEPFVERLAGLGVGAIEAQLSPNMRSDDIARWSATVDAAARHKLAVGFHVPFLLQAQGWFAAYELVRTLQGGTSATLIVHGCAGRRPDPKLVELTVAQLRRLADSAPDVTIALENVANLEHGPIARLRAWIARRRRAAAGSSRPSGVGSGMGAPRAGAVRSGDEPVDAPLPRQHGARWNAAGSRQAAWDICASVERPNCVLAWDLAHDWLAGRTSAVEQPAVPSAAMLRRVGYVRVHDVDDKGNDHCLLVMGNVPYTTQLRALLAADYAGTVCLAARYTAAMRPYGGRWQTFERSIRILQQTLKLP